LITSVYKDNPTGRVEVDTKANVKGLLENTRARKGETTSTKEYVNIEGEAL
jgi:hypothetical protein